VATLPTGAPGSAYEAFARQYAKILKRSGVELKLMPSTGAVSDDDQSPELISLGTLFYEPLWVFYRSGLKVTSRLDAFHGKRVAIGPERIHINLVRDRLQQLPAAADAPRRPRSDFTADVTSAPS
jgi:TRAP-type uncharacterized transport system substrate-binding protein